MKMKETTKRIHHLQWHAQYKCHVFLVLFYLSTHECIWITSFLLLQLITLASYQKHAQLIQGKSWQQATTLLKSYIHTYTPTLSPTQHLEKRREKDWSKGKLIYILVSMEIRGSCQSIFQICEMENLQLTSLLGFWTCWCILIHSVQPILHKVQERCD